MTQTNTAPVQTAQAKEKIIFETKSLLLPTILNLENLITIGFVVIATIASVVFRFGLSEILIVAALFLILLVPSLRSIFQAGSTTYVLTNHRLVIFSVGFGQKERSIPLDRIAEVKASSSFLQRFYGAGDIAIKQKGLRSTVRMVGLLENKKRAEQIRQAIKKAAG